MTSDDRAISALTWLWRLIKGWSPQVLGVLATGASIVWGTYADRAWTEGIWALWTTLGLLVLALIAQIFLQTPSYMQLAEKLRNTEQTATSEQDRLGRDAAAKSSVIADAMQVLLRKIAEHCNVDSNSDRVSVYYFHQDRFVMLARYALHPDYVRAGRGEYPVGQGAIGDAWEIGSVVVSLPPTRAQWERRLVSKHGYTAKAASELRMHCVGIAALRIEVDHRAVGVIVFESDEQDTVSQETIDAAKSSMLFAALSEIVSAAAMHTPGVTQLVGPALAPAAQTSPEWKSPKTGASAK